MKNDIQSISDTIKSAIVVGEDHLKATDACSKGVTSIKDAARSSAPPTKSSLWSENMNSLALTAREVGNLAVSGVGDAEMA